jgi:hypothetical protein
MLEEHKKIGDMKSIVARGNYNSNIKIDNLILQAVELKGPTRIMFRKVPKRVLIV